VKITNNSFFYSIRVEYDELKNHIIGAFDEIAVEIRKTTLLEYRESLYSIAENENVHIEV